MYTRRRALLLGATGIAALSGCTELASGDGPITREASPAAVAQSVLDETGHELEDQREETISREFEVGGQTRQVEATNYATVYTRTVGEGGAQGSLFAVVSTPAFKFAGQSFNPVASASNAEILEFVAGQFGGLSGTESVSQSTQTVLGTEATVAKFGAEATFNGERIPIYIHVASVENEGDIVIGAGAYPQALEGSEEAAMSQLFGGIVHPAE
jgi:hypothetical protein